ncbi:MAG TPA: hypothetical protein VJS44_07415 [Pyrinomonadaceae bacterium]|nr:hypothetical protein [Pyrinomonadaceae bacterium]
MMSRYKTRLGAHVFPRLIAVLAITCALFTQAQAQQTAGGTQINNQASATYTDGNGNNFDTVSNTVTVTVANVSGLTITPDDGTNSTVVAGEQNVDFVFRITNTGNFSDQVRFLANGGSIRVVGPGTIQSAVILGPNTNIFTNGSDVDSAAIAQNGFIDVRVRVNINSNASAGSTVQVILGDAPVNGVGDTTYDNVAVSGAASANEVRTVSGTSVNGQREARGDAKATVENNAQLQVTLTAPAGPVALGSNISYQMQTCNVGQRTASSMTLGGTNGVFIVAPIPVGTALTSGQTFPAGTLYTVSPLTTAPSAATWTNTAPGTLSSVTRVAFNVGGSIAAAACSSSVTMQVTITTTNATTPIYEIVDTFANNTIGTLITDQSGDAASNRGDLNANFDEPLPAGTPTANQGIQQQTLLQQLGDVLIGPNGQPAATGPTNTTNDDYTNRSTGVGISGVAPGGITTAADNVNGVVFTNTVQNRGNANDTFALTAPTVPAGFTVEISTDNGSNYTTVSGGGSVNLAIAYNSSAQILVRVKTTAAGKTVLTGYDVVIQAASGITPANTNRTIDRYYTGFIRLDKTYTITNSTGVGGANDPVPGAVITYTITYSNVASTGGTNSVTLTANNLVITENGNTATNNWATYTTHVINQATDNKGGTITGDSVATSTVLTDTIATLPAGQTGIFTFKRQIK